MGKNIEKGNQGKKRQNQSDDVDKFLVQSILEKPLKPQAPEGESNLKAVLKGSQRKAAIQISVLKNARKKEG